MNGWIWRDLKVKFVLFVLRDLEVKSKEIWIYKFVNDLIDVIWLIKKYFNKLKYSISICPYS